MKPHSQTDERLFLSIKERQLYPPYPSYDASHQQWLLFVIGIVLCHGSFSPMMKQRLTLKWEHDTSTACNRRMLKRSMPTRSHHATPCEAYWAGERLWIWIISTAFLFLHSLQVEGKGCRTSGRIGRAGAQAALLIEILWKNLFCLRKVCVDFLFPTSQIKGVEGSRNS